MRGSIAAKDLSKGGAGIQAGNYRVESASFGVFQYPPNRKTGKQSDPFTAMLWTLQKLNGSWKDTEDPTEVMALRIGDMSEFRPGKLNAKDVDNLSKEPKDLGDETGTEGNALVIDEESQVWGRSALGLMQKSIEELGFPPEIGGKCYAPLYEGLTLHIKVTERKVEGKDGEEDRIYEDLTCDKIAYMPGESDGSKSTKKASKAEPAASSSDGDDDDATTELAQTTVKAFANNHKGKSMTRKVFQKGISNAMMANHVSIANQQLVLDILKDDVSVGVLGTETEKFMIEITDDPKTGKGQIQFEV